ncbi:unnamed protein product [Ectocarpus sp. 4 AP-2014]
MTLPPRARQSSVSDEAASIAVSLAAIDWDVALVDKDVRRLLEVLQDDGSEGKTYAGRSNSTPEGKAFLQNQVDGLMREKAQYKEKRMVLMQRQQELQGGGGRGSSASVANSSSEIPKATTPSLPQTPTNDNSTHSTSRRGSFPLGPRPSPAPGSLRAPSPAKTATEAEADRRAVAETTVLWKDTVTSGTYDAPKKTAALYAPDGTLWGTVSEEVRDTPQQIYAYFDYFARLPELRVVEYTPVAVRVYGDFAVQAGTYTFSWQADDGTIVEKRARFSFTFRRDNPGTERPWTIVEHHSSSMPTAPAGLKAVGLGPGIPRGPRVVKETTPADQKAVAATAVVWKDTVTMGTDDTPRKTADLYAQDATLWGTVSEEVRDTPEQIYAYFDYFARLPALRLVEYTPVAVRVYGDFAVQAGTYTFSWQDNDGATVEKRARFSFTFRRDPTKPQEWAIVEHHSSSMPTAPAGLKPAMSGTNLADLTHDTGKATATTAPSSSATQSAASARDEDAAPTEAGGAGAAAATGSAAAATTTTTAAAAAAAAAGVDYMRFPVTEEGDDEEGASATAPSESIFKMLPRTACTAACGAAVAAAIVGFVAAVLMAPALSSTDLEAAPIGKVAVVNVAAAVAAAVATGLAPVGGALSRM